MHGSDQLIISIVGIRRVGSIVLVFIIFYMVVSLSTRHDDDDDDEGTYE